MYRVILAWTGANRYGPEVDEYEGMTDEQILWEQAKDAWQERCEQAYNMAVNSDMIEDMDYGQLVDFVADHAKVETRYAGYFVDQFMRWEAEPLPLRASTVKERQSNIQASTGSKKITSKSWPELCKQINLQWGFNVDAADRRRYSEFITLLKEGEEFEAEVTKYHDGTYELLLDNIYEIRDDSQYFENAEY